VNALLRQYGEWECGQDGYPWAWHHSTAWGAYPAGDPRSNPAIKDLVRMEAGHRCVRCGHPYRKGEVSERGEWSPCDEQCDEHPADGVRLVDAAGVVIAEGRGNAIVIKDDLSYVPVEPTHYEAKWRILTVHHLDEDKANCRWWNLASLCQRCHLRMQRAVVMGRPYHYEHSEWFKPYAAGFYAWKYLGEDLGREETLSRLPELLALEHRFTQEALL